MTSVGEHATAAQTTRLVDSASAFVEFTVNYEQTMHLAAHNPVHSDAIAAGGHMWRIKYCRSHLTGGLGVALQLLSESSDDINAIFEVVLIDKDGTPVVSAAMRIWRVGTFCGTILWLHPPAAKSTDLVSKNYLKDGRIRFLCTIRVLHHVELHEGNSVPATAPSDIAKDLSTLLDTADGTDVSFVVDGETFHAHRAILVARSPVFRAELLGSMAEATMSSITLHDIAPATFRAMLRFMYTDALPRDHELGGPPLEMFQHLLAAADRYALDRLKLLCGQKLWDNVSVDTVATILACAEMYSCHELKNMCVGFFAVEKNFRKAVLTEGFARLVHQFPSIITELRDSTGAS